MTEKKTTRRRARTKDGHFKADDPSTPDVNEAWEDVEVKETKPKKAAPKKAEAPKDDIVWFESRNAEPTMFKVAGINPIRNFSNGRLEYKVKADDADRFMANHFCMTGRIVKKA